MFALAHAPWSEMARAALGPAMAGDPLCDVGWLQDEVQAGRIMLVEIRCGDLKAGYVALRFELYGDLREAVMVAAGSILRGTPLSNEVIPRIAEFARELGAQSIRSHTSRRGVGLALQRNGWAEVERVYRKVLS